MRDRFLRACRLQPVDRTPVWFMRQAGRSQPEYRALRERYSLLEICAQADLVAETTLRPVEQLDVDAAILFADIMLPLLGIGVAFDLQDGGPRIAHPIRSAADVQRLHRFDPEAATLRAQSEAIRLITASSPVPLIGFAGAPFTMASYLVEGGSSRDFLQTKTLMRTERDAWGDLMDRLAEMTIDYLIRQISAGVACVQLFDSWAGALAPADYRDLVAPYTRRILNAVKENGIPSIHFGTGTAGLLEHMAQAGGDVIGVDWRVDLHQAWVRIGLDRGIQGNLDPSALLAPEAVMRDQSRAILAQAAGRPGHIFNLGHGVLPGTSVERLRSLVQLVHSHAGAESAEVPA